jgi:TetR/AcrR family transcriptional regulator, transcriptional repressor for nem operon
MNDSKEHIIKVACKLFLQKSYREVTMQELVKSTGLSKGAFYHYFESKEQLFLEVLEFFFSSVMIHHYEKYSMDSFYNFYHDYANEIKTYGNEYVKYLIGDESEGQFNINFFNMAFDALKLFPDFRAKMVNEQKKELKIWIDVIGSARDKGEIKSTMSDEEIAQIYIYSSDGVAMHMVMKGTRVEEMVAPFMKLWDKLYEQIKA